MHTRENSYYNVPASHKNSLYGLQVHPIESQTGRHRRRLSCSAQKRLRRRLRIKCAFSISVILLTAAAGTLLGFLNTSISPWEKISSPAFFSTLDAEDQQVPSTGGLMQDNAGVQEGSVHIASFSKDWNLVLVNPWNPIPDEYYVDLVQIENGFVDVRCYPELQNMLADCAAAGLSPLICSSYRTQEKQEALFQERIDELVIQGYSVEDAYDKAATSVAKPGTSEHQLGLAVDIVDRYHQMLDTSQETTLVQQWLMENCWKYGFILRYPNGTSELTGIIYEPWHYRYVGKKIAKEIHKRGICLEEYLGTVQK